MYMQMAAQWSFIHCSIHLQKHAPNTNSLWLTNYARTIDRPVIDDTSLHFKLIILHLYSIISAHQARGDRHLASLICKMQLIIDIILNI